MVFFKLPWHGVTCNHFPKKYVGEKYVYYHDAKVLKKIIHIKKYILIIIKDGCRAVQTELVWKQIKGAVAKKNFNTDNAHDSSTVSVSGDTKMRKWDL